MTKTQEPTAEMATATDTFALISSYEIVADPRNVRDDVGDVTDLANSIFQLGLQQPLRVRRVVLGEEFGISAGTQMFMVMAGHRRLASIRYLEQQDPPMWSGDIPCMIAPDGISDDDVTAAMLVENLQRTDLNPVEEGHAFERLTKEFRYKRADLATKIGRSESYVSDRLALTKLPDCIKDSVSVGYYPLTAALLLKGVPAKVVEAVTKGGRLVVGQAEITRATQTAKYDELKAALLAAATKSGIGIVTDHRFSFRNKSEEIATFATLDDAKLLAAYTGAPKTAQLVATDSPYSFTFSFELRKPLTDKQLEARTAKQNEAYTIEEQERRAEQAARYEAERATWTDEYRDWVDTCDQLKAEHVAETEAHEQALINAHVQWAATVDTKKIARWAMVEMIAMADWHQRRKILEALGVDHTGRAEDVVLAEWIGDDAKRMVQACAMVLTIDSYNSSPNELAADDLDAFIAKAEITEPAELVLPPEPPKTKENPADDPINDVA